MGNSMRVRAHVRSEICSSRSDPDPFGYGRSGRDGLKWTRRDRKDLGLGSTNSALTGKCRYDLQHAIEARGEGKIRKKDAVLLFKVGFSFV